MVPNKDGSWIMCINYRDLNKINIKKKYPLPCIEDLLDQLQHAKFFTKLDLKSGYLQVRMKEVDIWKTSFKKKQGLYEWLVLPFWLCNAPATFMRLMNDVLRDFIDSCVILYLDNIFIFSATWEEHLTHLQKFLQVLREKQLLCNMKKCEFSKYSLIYLRHVIGGGEILVNRKKPESITNWLTPTGATETRIFVEAIQYIGKFILSFSTIAAPLHIVAIKSKGFD